MARRPKAEANKMVNVGIRIPFEVKKKLLDEVEATGVAEGTLARNYVLLGMQTARQQKTSFNPVISQIVDILTKCPARTQLDVLAIVRALFERLNDSAPGRAGRGDESADAQAERLLAERYAIEEAEIGQTVEIIGRLAPG